MKTFIPYALLLAFCAVAMIDASPTPRPAEPNWAAIAAPSPLCDCQPCKCESCLCNVVDEQPKPTVKESLTVPTAPKGGEVQSVQFTQPQAITKTATNEKGLFTQPQVLPVKPKAAPVAVRAPAVSYGSCGPGGCGVARRGLFGRRR